MIEHAANDEALHSRSRHTSSSSAPQIVEGPGFGKQGAYLVAFLFKLSEPIHNLFMEADSEFAKAAYRALAVCS